MIWSGIDIGNLKYRSSILPAWPNSTAYGPSFESRISRIKKWRQPAVRGCSCQPVLRTNYPTWWLRATTGTSHPLDCVATWLSSFVPNRSWDSICSAVEVFCWRTVFACLSEQSRKAFVRLSSKSAGRKAFLNSLGFVVHPRNRLPKSAIEMSAVSQTVSEKNKNKNKCRCTNRYRIFIIWSRITFPYSQK